MNPKYVTSLEMSKKLAPYFKDAEFWWWQDSCPDALDIKGEMLIISREDICCSCGDVIAPALLSDEILEMLPEFVGIRKGVDYHILYDNFDKRIKQEQFNANHSRLPDALGEMFLKLKEKGII